MMLSPIKVLHHYDMVLWHSLTFTTLTLSVANLLANSNLIVKLVVISIFNVFESK
jgi:hypothetical protein